MDAARESFEWYPKTGARHIATLTDWMAERQQDLGTYSYAADMKKIDDAGLLDMLSTRVPHGDRTRASSAPPRSASRHAGSTRKPASTCSCAW
jgi:hypothetical protein